MMDEVIGFLRSDEGERWSHTRSPSASRNETGVFGSIKFDYLLDLYVDQWAGGTDVFAMRFGES